MRWLFSKVRWWMRCLYRDLLGLDRTDEDRTDDTL